MTLVKTDIVAKDAAINTAFQPTATIPETNTQKAIERAYSEAVAAAGSIGGSVGSTDNALVRADGTGGSTLQGSSVTLTDAGIMNGATAVGVNAAADTTNRLSVASGAVLFNHEGTSSQVKVNKNATANTASHLFQVGFSGRAEFGLIGSDDFSMKTSPDGSAFTTGLTIQASDAALRVHVNLAPNANDGAALGTTALGWADLHLASGALINWASGNAVLTHSSGVLTVSTGDLRITTAGTNAASAVTVGGVQTLSNKSIALGSNTITGTTAQFNTALSDGDFATLAGAETLTNKSLTSPTITGSPTASGATWSNLGTVTEGTFANTGLHLLDTNASHDLIIAPGSNITADRTLTLTTGDSNITLDLTDPGADRVMIWDDSAGAWTAASLAAGLEISGTTIRALESFVIACSDETTNLTTGTAKVTFRMPYAFTLTGVRASVNTAPVGSTIIVDINENGSTIMAVTKLSIDASEETSTTAASAAVLSDTSLADDAEITIDIDQVGSTTPGKGLKVTLLGYRP